MSTNKAFAKLADGSKRGIVYVYSSFSRGGINRVDIMWADGYRRTHQVSFLNLLIRWVKKIRGAAVTHTYYEKLFTGNV